MNDEQLTILTAKFGDAVADLWNLIDVVGGGNSAYNTANQCWDDLLAEVTQLRAREAALVAKHEQAMEIVGVVADAEYVAGSARHQFGDIAIRVSGDLRLLEQARALVSSEKVSDEND